MIQNPSLKQQAFSYAILGVALVEAIAICALMIAILINTAQRELESQRSPDATQKTAQNSDARSHL
jgi:HAMP domain-containing protein